MMRIRLRFSKLGKIRFTSHRDVARMWERAFRRASLPVAYSEGFSPRPKLHFGLALPTGAESWAEYLDVDLVDDGSEAAPVLGPDDLLALPGRLSPVLPAGIDVSAAAPVVAGTDSLQQAVESSSWTIEVLPAPMIGEKATGPAGVAEAVERLLAADEIIMTRQRKGQSVIDDIRPYVIDLSTTGVTDAGVELTCELGTRPRGLRPAELVAALDGSFEPGRICRTHQWMQHDGARQEPLPPMATSAPHATARAS